MSDERSYTLSELQQLPHLCAIGNKVYDLKKWAPLHPGGDDIRLFGGYDATVHYQMLHPFHAGKPMAKAFEACCVGRFLGANDAATAKSTGIESLIHCRADGFKFDSPFAKDLIQSVKEYFTTRNLSPHAPPVFWARLVFYCSIFFVGVIAFIRQPSLWTALIAGIWSAFIGLNVQHDANHGALSKNGTVNKIFGSMSDLIGQARWLWMQQHVVHHHAYTNDHHCDRDSTSAEPFLFFNPQRAGDKSDNRRTALHAFQHILVFFILPFYYLLRFDFKAVWNVSKYSDTIKNPWLAEQRNQTVALWAIHMTAFYALPIALHFSWSTLFWCHIRDVTTSLILTMLFMLSHNAEPIKRYPTHDQCWYAMQVETSCTYGNGIAGALSGGLNYQIEHHLFPRICSAHYPALSPIVRQVCERHKVNYTYFPTIGENLASTLRYLRKAGMGAVQTGF